MPKISSMTDKYNLDITITLDFVPDEYDYNLILLDKHARLLGVGKYNGNGGKSITIPNWCFKDEGYTLKVQTSEGNDIISEESYSLTFRENTLHMEYLKMQQELNFNCVLRRKLWEKNENASQNGSVPRPFSTGKPPNVFARGKYEERYLEQMDAMEVDTQEFYA